MNNDPFIVITCPHEDCRMSVLIYHHEINCRIFRHAVYIASGEQVPPHLDKQACEELVRKQLVWGCCKPFRLNEQQLPEICDYL